MSDISQRRNGKSLTKARRMASSAEEIATHATPMPGEVRWQDKEVPLCELDPARAASLPLLVSHGTFDVTAIRSKVEELGSDLWDPAFAQKQNVKLKRSGHDNWGVQKAVLIFCDDFVKNVLELPFWREWAPLLMPLFDQMGLPVSRIARCLFAGMPPGCTIPVHHDSGHWVTHAHRVHLPIITHPSVVFKVGVTEDSMLPAKFVEGSIVEFNNRSKHYVHNGWTQMRVHLIFDFLDEPTPITFHRRVLQPGEGVVQTRRSVDLVTDYGKGQCIPRFAVIGAMKAGTTFLYNSIVQHPLVAKARRKEPHFFDWRWPSELQQRSVEEQRAAYMEYFEHDLLQRHTSIITGEATPSYLLYSGVVLERFRTVVPAAVRLLAMLRDPVQRAWSQFQMVADTTGTAAQLQNRGHDKLAGRTFEAVVEEELAALGACGVTADGEVDLDRFQTEFLDGLPLGHGCHGFVARGLYLAQIQLWLRVYPREQLLLLCLEEMKKDPQRSYDQALEHIGLPPHVANFEEVGRNARNYAPLCDATRAKLAHFYQAHNERLFEFLGRRLPWLQPAGGAGGSSIFAEAETEAEAAEE